MSSHLDESRRKVDLDKSIKQFLRYTTNTPDNVATPLFYADRNIGGWGLVK